MSLSCRNPQIPDDEIDPEDLMRIFLLESFESEFVYIISPWISTYNFSKKIIYYPYVSSYNIAEVLEALHEKGVKVYILARCFDDFLSPDLIYLLYKIYIKGIEIPHDLLSYLKGKVDDALRRIELSEKIVRAGVNFRTDYSVNKWYRLHAKIYVNNKLALVGSANFSRSGIVKGGNWECLLMVDSSNGLYNKLLYYAQSYYNIGKSYEECKERIIRTINRYLKDYVRINSFEQLKTMLKDLYYSL